VSQRVHGDLQGLAAVEKSGLERLYHHGSAPGELASDALVLRMCHLAARLRRQVGVLIDRQGAVTHVLCGNDHELQLPDLGRFGSTAGRLRGLRLVHVHLKGEPLTDDDLNDLARLRLDLVAAIGLHHDGPGQVFVAHVAAAAGGAAHQPVQPYELLPPAPWRELQLDVAALLNELETELARVRPAARVVQARERAVLVHVGPEPISVAEDRLDELEELARTARVEVVGRVVQRRQKVDPRTLIGSGKLSEIALRAMQTDAGLLVFDTELTPSQSKSIAQQVELKVLDRTQLILDIFAGRARSQDGKLQVELAQLRYSLPRLGDRDNALSRLTGGIGGVGPGETKLEIDRRRARDRVHRIESELSRLARGRAQRRQGRVDSAEGLVALVGYTNVGKSSLLNAIAKSDVFTENLLFATLDPTSRRVRMPEGTMVVWTDTVGFIRDLPKELKGAFEATLEEARAADLLVVVLDASHPQVEQQLASVRRILADHGMAEQARLLVANKVDAADDPALVRELVEREGALPVSAKTRAGLGELMADVERAVLAVRSRPLPPPPEETPWQP
jgi:GTP-binding protein HflX